VKLLAARGAGRHIGRSAHHLHDANGTHGLVPRNMVEVVQESARDEAKNKPESRFKNFLESGRHESNHVKYGMLKP
jgi:hypothetical protein